MKPHRGQECPDRGAIECAIIFASRAKQGDDVALAVEDGCPACAAISTVPKPIGDSEFIHAVVRCADERHVRFADFVPDGDIPMIIRDDLLAGSSTKEVIITNLRVLKSGLSDFEQRNTLSQSTFFTYL